MTSVDVAATDRQDVRQGVLQRGRSQSLTELANRSDWIRLETIKLIDQAGFGHYSSTFSSAVSLPGVLLPHYGLTPDGIAGRVRRLLEA